MGSGEAHVEDVDVEGGDGDDDEVGCDGCAERGGDEGGFELHGCCGVLQKGCRVGVVVVLSN